MSAEKFKTGDKVIVIACNYGHMFKLGTEVTLQRFPDNYYGTDEDGNIWSLEDDELSSIEFVNVFGNENDLELFGSNGELRYSYLNFANRIVEVHYDEYGIQIQHKEKEFTNK